MKPMAGFDTHTLEVLEWPRVHEILVGLALTLSGQDRLRELAFHVHPDILAQALALTGEARSLLDEDGEPGFQGVHDCRSELRRLDLGATLTGTELVAIASTWQSAARLKRHLEARQDRFAALSDLARPIRPQPRLVETIGLALDPSGEVRDDASPDLISIRKRLVDRSAELEDLLLRLVRRHGDALQDTVTTTRKGRFVLLVRSEARSQVPGIVHDQSATGMTLFIEPMSLVEPTNGLERLRLEERDEIARILEALTGQVRHVSEETRWMLEALAELDAVLARGRLALRWGGTVPRLGDDGATVLYGARHPLLIEQLGDKVIPVGLGVGDGQSIVVITGPNTGGKTVALKTLGLVTLMVQAGLFPPIESSSRVAPVRQIFADIGDEQSLSQNLSTFSGHMRNLVHLLGRADDRTLVLLDELGAGTDPHEGAALARALLETLQARGARVVATTHFGELKRLAYELPGFANASVQFDARTMRPTYRILMGVPGQSNALAIASQLGLPPHVASRAREILQRGSDESAGLMGRLEDAQLEALRARAEADRRLAEAERLRSEHEARVSAWNQERREIRTRYRETLEEELRQARSEISAVTRELQADRTMPVAQRAHDRLARLQERIERARERERTQVAVPRTWKAGDRVFLARLQQAGELLEVSGDQASVQVGPMKLTVPLRDLQPAVSREPVSGPARNAGGRHARREKRAVQAQAVEAGGHELDLRGCLVHEAIGQIESFMDRALSSHLRTVRIIHGGGTGALRKGIRAFLATSPHVSSFRPGEGSEGGDGVTVVMLV